MTSPAGTWQSRPSMRNARAAHAVVSTGSILYALAGTGQGGLPVLEVERFDGKSWQPETSLPGDGLNAPAAAMLDDNIYLPGGFNTTSNIPSDQLLVYNPGGHIYESVKILPIEHYVDRHLDREAFS